MQVNAVSAKATAFGRSPSREDFEQFAAADDRELRQIARQAASVQVNDKKHARINNALWYSLPIAAGLSAIVKQPEIVGRIPKLKLFAKNAGIIGGTLLAIDGTFAAARAINNHSETMNDFNKKHPIMSSLLTLGASVAVMFAGAKGLEKLYAKYGDKAIQFLKDKKVDKFIKDNKVITKVMDTVRKAPSAIKEIGKTLVSWSPWVLIGTSIAHTVSHEKAKTFAEVENYENLKRSQEKVRVMLEEA
jgi:hypothetical protein